MIFPTQLFLGILMNHEIRIPTQTTNISMESNKGWQHSLKRTVNLTLKIGRLPEGKDDIPTIHLFGDFLLFGVIFYTSLKENTFKIPPNVSFRDLNFLWWFCCDPNIHRGECLETPHLRDLSRFNRNTENTPFEKSRWVYGARSKPLENPYNAPFFEILWKKIEKTA